MVGGWIQGRSASAYSGTAFCVRGRKPGSALRDAAAPRDAPGQRGDADGLLTKLGALFQMRCPPWIEVDLSGWAQGQPPQETFETVKTAIFQRRVLSFCYFGSRGKSETRTARPIRLVFKSRDWYLYAFSLLRKDYRFFKLTRIRDLAMQEETFPPEPVPEKVAPSLRPERTVTVTLKFDRAAAFRVYDEFTAPITQDPQGDLYVQAELPEHERLYSYLLSFADQVEVLAPPSVREELKARLQKMQEKYKT